MPKFFITSDIHSFYEPFKQALDEVGFDPNNENHYLIVCGDTYDRGPDSEEVLHFLMQLDRKILIKGNHDILLEECCKREAFFSHDISNGTKKTIDDLGGAGEGRCFAECCCRTYDRLAAYRSCLVNYFETENYIFVHSWIPIAESEYKVDWRNATTSEWEDAMWGNPFIMALNGLNQTGKTIVFGHWHCSTGWALSEGSPEFGEGANFDPFYGNGFIAIDACTAYSGKCNVIVIEDEFLSN